MITEITKYGKGYETPQGLEEKRYYEIMYEFIDFTKVKGLTVRQAQKLFTDCADMVMDTSICNTVEYKKSEKPLTFQPANAIPAVSITYNGKSRWNSI